MTVATINDINKHERDDGIEFDAPTHTYRHGGREFRSVTTLVESCFEKFDIDYWAMRKARGNEDKAKELKALWEAEGKKARDLGTRMHAKIESYYLGEDDGDTSDALRLFRFFAAGKKLSPYRTEWRIYDEDFDLAGTLDFLERTAEGTFNIWDWKRSRKLVGPDGLVIRDNRFGTRAIHPALRHIHDTSYWHYALQLSIYRYILEHKYGITVNEMNLGVFHPENPQAYVIPLPYLKGEVESILPL